MNKVLCAWVHACLAGEFRMADSQHNPHRCTLTDIAFQLNASAMGLYDFPRDGKPQAGSVIGFIGTGAPVIPFKKFFLFCFFNPSSIVTDLDN
jgi:hypothetical protein